MKIDDIQIKVPKKSSFIAANVNFTLGDSIIFFGWTIVKKKAGGVFLSPPQRNINGKYFDLIRFAKKGWREEIEKAVMAEYKKVAKPEESEESSDDEELWPDDEDESEDNGDDLPF